MENKKVISAYSGGLDTLVILKWLINKGHEVVCYLADVGPAEDFAKAKEKAILSVPVQAFAIWSPSRRAAGQP